MTFKEIILNPKLWEGALPILGSVFAVVVAWLLNQIAQRKERHLQQKQTAYRELAGSLLVEFHHVKYIANCGIKECLTIFKDIDETTRVLGSISVFGTQEMINLSKKLLDIQSNYITAARTKEATDGKSETVNNTLENIESDWKKIYGKLISEMREDINLKEITIYE